MFKIHSVSTRGSHWLAGFTFFGLCLWLASAVRAGDPTLGLGESIVVVGGTPVDAFPLVAGGRAATLWYDESDFTGVIRAVGDLQADVERVTGRKPAAVATRPADAPLVIVGTLGKNALVDSLVTAGKIPGDELVGKWESFVVATVASPMPGVDRALVVAGSDKRGTIYGIYELSRQIGVSPWYWWADAPVPHRDEIHLRAGTFTSGEPKVKYRGIFINDEAPALRRWAEERFGGFNQKLYAHVFELILRCRANYLWPAMWLPVAFNDDDPGNPRLADEYGVVMSTSHHEPMMRAHHEWERYGAGPWNYEANGAVLREFWRGGFERVRDFESVVTVGMRGDGDEAMSEQTAVPLLKRIIADQREIIADVTGRPASETPQVWALYKEVQDYYDKGMRVDDDILVLFSDDNWGNIRFLPRPGDRPHPGGYGMYYHVDYVGAPVSYRWLNVSQIERIWEQMTLTYRAGVDRLWIVNVGDIKPMELPMSFFLDLAWNPDAIGVADLPTYYVHWASQQFGAAHAVEIGEMLALYTKYNARRTPEMLTAGTFSVLHYREADRVVAEYRTLAERARALFAKLPESHHAAYQQLVLFPIEACANVTEMYVAAGKNDTHALRGTAAANFHADRVRELFERDAELTRRFHADVADGKWNHMMSQTHLGYTYWNHPPLNRAPPVSYVQLGEKAELGFFVEHGVRPRWGWLDVEADWAFAHTLPVFDPLNDQDYTIEVFNRGREPLGYELAPRQDWIRLSKTSGLIQYDEQVHVTIDWAKAPVGRSEGEVVITGAGSEYVVKVPIRNERPARIAGFVANNGVVSIEAAEYDGATPAGDVRWINVPNLGRTGSAVTITPADAARRKPGEGAPSLEYTFTLFDAAPVSVDTYVSPTLNFRAGDGLCFAIAIDDEPPQIVNINEGEELPDWKYAAWWLKAVGDHIKIKRSKHRTLEPGPHTLKVWMVDSGVVLQKFVVDAGGLLPTYLGPPASVRHLDSTGN
ncbi:glycosyl hydrolase 115 family protein [Opitutales bacterium ASA1]|uniref:glycosyl hydrolase 115 family protein n=1 Tax=Congregicoccus parvus TaxID=3081749 RepID=UPI002B2CC4C6|nr:glycosyl hydrolase 115 family protein [Opitutales bacterium ASA1]